MDGIGNKPLAWFVEKVNLYDDSQRDTILTQAACTLGRPGRDAESGRDLL